MAVINTSRDTSIDLLKFIGLSMIILAHVDIPGIVAQLRNFDVPLMVLLSGAAYGLSVRKDQSYLAYLFKRFERLALPVWIFLTTYFISLLILSPDSKTLNTYTILTSYSFISGIGYVWIIRVFFLVALIAPLLYWLHTRRLNDITYLTIIFVTYLLYEVTLHFTDLNSNWFGQFILFYLAPYAAVFAIGLRLIDLSKLLRHSLTLFCLTAFISFLIYHYKDTRELVSTQGYKYPPTA